MGVSTLPRVFGGVGVSDDLTARPTSGVSESDTSATLVLNFISEMIQMAYRSRSLSDVVTFTRASTKTYFGSDGLLKTAAVDTWPLEYDPVTLAPIGRSVWEARTNLLMYSEQFDNAAWTKTNATVTPNNATAPDGTMTADLVAKTGADSTTPAQVVTVPSGQVTWSYHVKPVSGSGWIRLRSDVGGSVVSLLIDIVNDVVGTASGGVTGTITPLANGWKRVSATRSSAGGAASFSVSPIVSNSDTTGSGSISVWGAQLEAGAFATPYIPTTTAAATRAADVAVMTGTNFSDWYNQSEGTFVEEALVPIPLGAGSNKYGFSVSDGAVSTESINLFSNGSNTGGTVFDGGVQQVNFSVAPAPTQNTVFRAGFAYAANDFALCRDGGSVVTDVSGTPPTPTRITLGAAFNGSAQLNGHIRSITYYPKRLSNAQLQALAS